jgi:hypothetical protein
MKKLILFSIILMALQAKSQQMNIGGTNLGINNPNPLERLDVAGNINVTGTIKANGADGAAGQVLMKNDAGTLSWGNSSCYKNIKQFLYADGNQSFTVPAGVTSILFELWGAGGSSNAVGGGGGGAYVKAIFPVTPGEVLTVYVPSTGFPAGGTGTSGDGGNARVFTATKSILAYGGGGSNATNPGYGGSGGAQTGITNFFSIPGGDGEFTKITQSQISPTDYARYTFFGNGGGSGNIPHTGGNGGFLSQNLTTATTIQSLGSTYGKFGGGGGSLQSGSFGSRGSVIAYY